MGIRAVVPDLSGIKGMSKDKWTNGSYTWDSKKQKFIKVRDRGNILTAESIPNEPHYNPAFGCVVKNKRHLLDLRKKGGTVGYEKGIFGKGFENRKAEKDEKIKKDFIDNHPKQWSKWKQNIEKGN